MGVRRPSFAHVRSQDSWTKDGIRTLKGLLATVRDGLYLEGSLALVQELGPPYVDDGVVNVDALLDESKMEAIDDAVLLWLVGLCGV